MIKSSIKSNGTKQVKAPAPEVAYRNIVEWLYLNDREGTHYNNIRKELIEVLRFNILGQKEEKSMVIEEDLLNYLHA